jgi:uncharacterized membrane protein (UPF0127 family)
MTKWRSRTTALLIAGLAIVVLAAVLAFLFANIPSTTTEVRLGSGVFKARIADDTAEREKGLSGVASLRPDEGLLMIFDGEGQRPIWMKDMKVSIDIIWLDSKKKVVAIVKNANPASSTDTKYGLDAEAQYVLELPAGTVEAAGIRTGQAAIFEVAER